MLAALSTVSTSWRTIRATISPRKKISPAPSSLGRKAKISVVSRLIGARIWASPSTPSAATIPTSQMISLTIVPICSAIDWAPVPRWRFSAGVLSNSLRSAHLAARAMAQVARMMSSANRIRGPHSIASARR